MPKSRDVTAPQECAVSFFAREHPHPELDCAGAVDAPPVPVPPLPPAPALPLSLGGSIELSSTLVPASLTGGSLTSGSDELSNVASARGASGDDEVSPLASGVVIESELIPSGGEEGPSCGGIEPSIGPASALVPPSFGVSAQFGASFVLVSVMVVSAASALGVKIADAAASSFRFARKNAVEYCE
jgi:hypothetical protein